MAGECILGVDFEVEDDHKLFKLIQDQHYSNCNFGLLGLLGWPLGFVELCWALCHFRFVAIPCDVGGICARYALHT